MSGRSAVPVLRKEAVRVGRVTPFELFFDLVFVFAVTRLSHALLTDLSWGGAARVGLLLVAVWWAWMYTTWALNWVDPDNIGVRLLLMAGMLLSLLMAVAIPDAFGADGLLFAGALVAFQVGRTVGLVLLLPPGPVRTNFRLIAVWLAGSGALWVAGAFVDSEVRVWVWLAALAIDLAGPWAGYRVPGLGRSTTADWDISADHMAERCQLFMIIVLGESIILTGATFGALEPTAIRVVVFGSAFVTTAGLWWLYFGSAAPRGVERFAGAADPGSVGRAAYTYGHIPMVAGVIVTAVGDELSIAHPSDAATMAAVLVMAGGPLLYFVGHAAFEWLLWRTVPVPVVVAALATVPLLVVGVWLPLWAVSLATTALVVGVVAAVQFTARSSDA